MDIIPISADDHIWEHPTTWTSRVEARFRDRCPQLRDIDGEDWWVYNDEPVRKVGTGAAALIEGRGRGDAVLRRAAGRLGAVRRGSRR